MTKLKVGFRNFVKAPNKTVPLQVRFVRRRVGGVKVLPPFILNNDQHYLPATLSPVLID